MFMSSLHKIALLSLLLVSPLMVGAQELLPGDNGLEDYHTQPRWRESESHPLRVAAYILHPVGWLAREVVFRPFSWFASSTETRRSVMGFREPYDYRQPECFSVDDSVPDCRSMAPFNYERNVTDTDESASGVAHMYFPDVNFDFDKRTLNQLGLGRVRQVADVLSKNPVKVVLEGHADYKGSDAYNQKLGMDRAEAVKSELARLGISTDRLSTVTFGESRPLINEDTDYARAVNRRVEVHSDNGTAAQ
jgi:hypothetical protein